jgi:hypothetical protein
MKPCPFNRLELETLEDRNVPSTVAADYTDGLWRWDSTLGWGHLSAGHASRLDVDDAGDVYGQFGNGIWRWSASTFGWQKLSDLQATDFQVTAGGVFYGDFGSIGVWRWSFDGWQKITPNDVHAFSVSDSDAFFGSFGGFVQGTWRWTPLAGWSKLGNSEADKLKTDQAGDMYGVYSSPNIAASQVGTWRWTPADGWARLSTAVPLDLAVSNIGAVYEKRAGAIWYLPSDADPAFFAKLTASSANTTMTALPDGTLVYTAFDAVAGTYRTFYRNPDTGGFLKIDVSLGLAPVAVGKDDDVFFAFNGLSQWSASMSLTQLGAAPIIGAVGSQR